MLYKTTFSPSGLKLGETTYTPFVGLLREFDKNCLIFVDSQGKLEATLATTIQSLPPKYQRQAKEYHKSLKSKGRIVTHVFTELSTLDEEFCAFHRSAIFNLPQLLIFTGEDCCIGSDISPKSRMIKVEEYLLSNRFMEERKDNQIFSDGQVDKNKMGEEIFQPLFETAKSIKIVDRYIGRSMLNKHGNIEPSIVEHYKKNLMWLLGLFDRCHSQLGRRFEIYTGVDPTDLTSDETKYLYDRLMQFSDLVKVRFTSFEFALKIKQETRRYQEMPHARYLITNQIAVLIERGFDLLWNDDQMSYARLNPTIDQPKIRDVAIVRISEPGKVESSIRLLPDLSTSFS